MRRGWPLLVLILFGAVIALVCDSGGEDTPSPAPELPPEVEGHVAILPSPSERPAGEEDEAAAGHMVIRGRVVHRDRSPVSGAVVMLRARDGQECRSVTDATGAYEVEAGSRPAGQRIELSIHVVHESGAAARTMTVSARRPDLVVVAPLVLGPAHGLPVRVTCRGEPMAKVRVLALFHLYGSRTLLSSRVTDSSGECRFTGLPGGKLQFIATTETTGRGLARVELPGEIVEPVSIVLTEPRPLRIRVLDRNEGTPVAGATFEVMDAAGGIREPFLPAASVPPTGPDGWTAVPGIGLDEHFQVRARHAGFPPSRRASPPKGATEWEIRLPPYRTVTWAVVPGLAPVPPDGAEIRLQTSDNMQFHWQPRRGYMEGDLLRVPQCQEGYIAVYGIAPDGSIADLDYDIKTDGGGTISFRPPRTVRVRIRDSEGRPQPGLQVDLDVDGASLNAGWRWTDGDGIALWENVYGNNTEITLEGMVLATLDLAKEGADLDITLEPRREVVFRVKLNGRARLPESYKLYVDSEARKKGITEDPESGEIGYGFHPPPGESRVSYRLGAKGYHSHWGSMDLKGEGPIVLDVDLVPVSVLSALVLPKDGGRFSTWYGIQLQGWDDAESSWAFARGGRLGRWHADEDGLIHADDLEAGRYRFVHTESGIASKAVTLAAGDSRQVSLDLSHVAKVGGRVVVPDGRGFDDVRVVFAGGAPDLSPWGDGMPGVSVNRKTGAFEIQVPGDREVLLRAVHPLLACPEPVRILGAREHVQIELFPTTTARLTIEPEPDFSGYLMPPLVRLYRAPMKRWDPGKEIGVHLFAGPLSDPLPAGSPVEFSGKNLIEFQVRQGTWNVLLDVPGLVPKVLPSVRFGPGVNDLGTVTFDEGSQLRVEVAMPSGVPPGRVIAVARNRERPAYVRKGYADGRDFTVVDGLERGSYSVKVTVLLPEIGEAYPIEFERTVSVDGRKTETIRIEVEF